jgi:hypothetical protein
MKWVFSVPGHDDIVPGHSMELFIPAILFSVPGHYQVTHPAILVNNPPGHSSQ